MKIAFIVLCHKNPNQVNKLIESLTGDNRDFYIHIDKKCDFKNDICEADNIFVLDDSKRVDVKWGQISMIDATFNAIGVIIETQKEYDYIWLISGQDYPLKSKEYIDNYLKKNSGANFIEVFNDDQHHKRFLKRTSLYYPKWIVNNNIMAMVIKKLYIDLTGGHYRTFLKRKNSTGLEFYFGSQWWALTFDFIKYAYEFYNNNPDVIRFFENTIIPDESLFQTIIMNSKYKDTVQNHLTYVNRECTRRSPKDFTISDIDELIDSKYLLARKFDENVDKDIIRMIEDFIKDDNNNCVII